VDKFFLKNKTHFGGYGLRVTFMKSGFSLAVSILPLGVTIYLYHRSLQCSKLSLNLVISSRVIVSEKSL
jgi:hypothetical protein